MKMDAKKKSHTSSGLSIIKGFLFRGRLTDHSSLLGWGTATESTLYQWFIVYEVMPKWVGNLKATGQRIPYSTHKGRPW